MHFNKGDVRKSMLDLQFLSQSGSSHDICDCVMSEVKLSVKQILLHTYHNTFTVNLNFLIQ